MNGYLTSENLIKTANDLEKFLSNKSRVIVTSSTKTDQSENNALYDPAFYLRAIFPPFL